MEPDGPVGPGGPEPAGSVRAAEVSQRHRSKELLSGEPSAASDGDVVQFQEAARKQEVRSPEFKTCKSKVN